MHARLARPSCLRVLPLVLSACGPEATAPSVEAPVASPVASTEQPALTGSSAGSE
ncbi:hypothetical protein HUA78_27800 [Myxococcus sp. CA033]|uniref:hypothetical protein n=1 Tax=Myxococcus sp. CA033 TaxID=2741516 RepID=UPI00157B0428|nr:hypothetical protein [Myxococcus sp. CA033]NTX38257.1 hypothetical protein [Myxococcus sp. CA033]